MSENDYIYSEEGKKKFKKWYDANKKTKKMESKQRVEIEEKITPTIEVPEVRGDMKQSRNLASNKDISISTKLE